MLNESIEEYTAILDRDPLDHGKSTDHVPIEFLDRVIQEYLKTLTPDTGHGNYYLKQHALWTD